MYALDAFAMSLYLFLNDKNRATNVASPENTKERTAMAGIVS